MVSAVPNPALDAFIAAIASEMVFGQVLLRTTPEGFQLNHVEDRDCHSVRDVTLSSLRDIAQFTAAKQFRPLKTAPTLQRGWRFLARSASELNDALQCLYPGGIADWFAVRQPNPPVTHYRDFAARQSGMYRVTTLLDDNEVAQLARAGCHGQFCLKQRLWQAGNQAAEDAREKSLIPCLEPCALLLEFARFTARTAQQEKRVIALAPDEIETCILALEQVAQARRDDLREADFSARDNPRRVVLLVEKLKATSTQKTS